MTTPENLSEKLAPFSCSFSRDLPDLLSELQCSLLVSTYQANKIIFISPQKEQLVQLTRNFDQPMGVAIEGSKMAVATRNEVIYLVDSPELAKTYPNSPQTYDHLFIPRHVYFTGVLATHDMGWGKEGLIGVNTSFSCLCRLTGDYNFTPIWKPHFITDYAAEDRCHLNGMALVQGEPAYVTALGHSNTAGGWRKTRPGGGILMDVKTQEIILSDLSMPHSPRVYDGKLYLLLSATGELVRVDPGQKKYEVIKKLPGFVRGLAKYGDFLFIGMSRLRKNHVFGDLPLAQQELKAGVAVVHIKTGALVGMIEYNRSCEEIYDVQVLPQALRPNILNTQADIFRMALTIPQTTFWGKMVEKQPK